MFMSANYKELSYLTEEQILQSLLDQAVKLYADISFSMESNHDNYSRSDVEDEIYKLRQGELTQLVEDITFSLYATDKETKSTALDHLEMMEDTKEQSYVKLIHQFDDAIRNAVKNDDIDGNELLLDLAMEIQDYDEDFLKNGEPVTMMNANESTNSKMVLTPAKNSKVDGMLTRLEQLQLLVSPSSTLQLSSSSLQSSLKPDDVSSEMKITTDVKKESIDDTKKNDLKEKMEGVKISDKNTNDSVSKEEKLSIETKINGTSVDNLQNTNPSEGIAAALSVGAAFAVVANYVPGVENAISPIISKWDKML